MIDGKAYFERLAAVKMQFDLARRALDGFLTSKDAVDKYCEEELNDLRDLISKAQQSKGIDIKQHGIFTADGASSYIESIKAHTNDRIDDVKNRISQNELILMIALFEKQMKDVHREILKHNPSLLSPDRQVPLGRIIELSYQQVIEEEIEREVSKWDRLNIRKRCEYFSTRLNIDWFDGHIVPLAEYVLDIRNKILHEDEGLVVTGDDLGMTYVVCGSLVSICILQASVLYPDAFKWGEMSTDGIRELMEKQGRIKPQD